jgi:hypothetical protein
MHHRIAYAGSTYPSRFNVMFLKYKAFYGHSAIVAGGFNPAGKG